MPTEVWCKGLPRHIHSKQSYRTNTWAGPASPQLREKVREENRKNLKKASV